MRKHGFSRPHEPPPHNFQLPEGPCAHVGRALPMMLLDLSRRDVKGHVNVGAVSEKQQTAAGFRRNWPRFLAGERATKTPERLPNPQTRRAILAAVARVLTTPCADHLPTGGEDQYVSASLGGPLEDTSRLVTKAAYGTPTDRGLPSLPRAQSVVGCRGTTWVFPRRGVRADRVLVRCD